MKYLIGSENSEHYYVYILLAKEFPMLNGNFNSPIQFEDVCIINHLSGSKLKTTNPFELL